jgi:signal transduction histidine kinase
LQTAHELLEERVRQRTTELQGTNERLQREVEERQLAEQALRKEQTTLKHLLQSSDHERQLIAYEIHDGLAQQLTAAIMYFQGSGRRSGQDAEVSAAAYDTGVSLLRQSLGEARRLISGVRPPILDELGIVAALNHLILDCQARREAPEIDFQNEVEFDRLASIVENALYRIAQEGLSNALAHSGSTRMQVNLIQQDNHIRLQIQDWGVGFHTEDVMENCFGLDGIRERARLLGGSVEIASVPGEGTRITVDLPIITNGMPG